MTFMHLYLGLFLLELLLRPSQDLLSNNSFHLGHHGEQYLQKTKKLFGSDLR